ncbi:MAG: pyridoxamine 5'-phosphate oxidase [Spirochaetia bacterium]|nr:pyridoxamine 5'-phosphate oxidase [Spirochaetia bacterium]
MSEKNEEIKKEKYEKLRREYTGNGLLEKDIFADPIKQFEKWFEEALSIEVIDVNAGALCTVREDNSPDTRIVLLKSFDKEGFVFYTNYLSRKAQELKNNNKASYLFYWSPLSRQVRIDGIVKKISKEEAEKYFKTRPEASKIGAWASKQSHEIKDRKFLEDEFAKYKKEFAEKEITMPEYWGGYILIPSVIEFWQGRESRLHDRIEYRSENNIWKTVRLSP